MEFIAFYISNHGFGHITRCLAIIEELLKRTDYSIYIAGGKAQNDFAKIYLNKYKNRIVFNNVNTDIGLINKRGSLNIDKDTLQLKLYKFIDSLDDKANDEFRNLNHIRVNLIVTDISVLGIIVGKKLGVKVIGISNFTWYQQYKYLGLNSRIVNIFNNYYSQLDLFVEYDLAVSDFSLNIRREKTSLLSRNFSDTKIQSIKEKFNRPVFVSFARSAEKNNINLQKFNGTIIHTEGTNIKPSLNKVKLPINVLDSHNYIAACEFIIAKAGWGIVSEAILSKKPLVLIDREDVAEDTNTINLLKNEKLAISITENDLENLDYQKLKERIRALDTKSYNKYTDSKEKVYQILKRWV